jgi:FkbM family methyltransferase
VKKILNKEVFHLKIKRIIPTFLYRWISILWNTLSRFIPITLVYNFLERLKKNEYPYSLIEDGDVVVQVGCPKDILWSGHSRSILFARRVGSGVVVVIEPDPENCNALRKFVDKYSLQSKISIVEYGAWDCETTLTFLSSPNHPAANLIAGVADLTDKEKEIRNYQEIKIKTKSIDQILAELSLSKNPRLISITTNGAETAIMKGIPDTIDNGLKYISMAATGKGYIEMLKIYGYEHISNDDRGFTFKKMEEQS